MRIIRPVAEFVKCKLGQEGFDKITSIMANVILQNFSHLIIRSWYRSDLSGIEWPEVRAHGSVWY